MFFSPSCVDRAQEAPSSTRRAEESRCRSTCSLPRDLTRHPNLNSPQPCSCCLSPGPELSSPPKAWYRLSRSENMAARAWCRIDTLWPLLNQVARHSPMFYVITPCLREAQGVVRPCLLSFQPSTGAKESAGPFYFLLLVSTNVLVCICSLLATASPRHSEDIRLQAVKVLACVRTKET